MPFVNRPTRVPFLMKETPDKICYAFVFSSDIRDWMPKVDEKREKQREYRVTPTKRLYRNDTGK
jgi:hypothetical protein